MKIVFTTLALILLFGCSLSRNSRKNSSNTGPQLVKIYCMDGFNNEKLPDCRAYSGDSLLGISDSTGWIHLVLNSELNHNTIRLVANDTLHTNANYASYNRYFNTEITVIFYPNQAYENLIWERDNQKYGYQSKEKMLYPTKSPLLGAQPKKETTEALFPGGNAGMSAYITNQVVYPTMAIEEDISGSVRLNFIVQKDGAISHIIPSLGTHPILNQEAVRVIRNSPKWTPGSEEGVPVKTRCLLPVNFKLY